MVETKSRKLKVLFLAVLAVIFVMVYAPGQTHAAAGINQQISFEGKIVTGSGVNVPDGTYNLEFKIYQDGTGCVSGGTSPCGGTLKWTEDRLVSASKGVTVTAGTFQVNLGSVNPFGGNIDWNQDTLWLSMNVGGTGTTASWDGEMTPFIRLTAVPYALNAGTVGGLSASQLVQLQTGTITNQTGGLGVTGNVQAGGTVSALTVTQNGNAVCDTSSNCTNYLSGSTGVQLQSSTPGTAQTGNFNISGTGIAGALQVASGGTLDSTSLGILNIGTTAGTSTVNIGKSTQAVILPGSLSLNGSTANNIRLGITGTEASSNISSQYGIQGQLTFAPTGASLTSLYALLNTPSLGTSSTPVTSVYGSLSRVDTTSNYTGQITNAIGFNAGTPSLVGSNPITNYYGVKVDNVGSNAGVSGNTATNYGVSINVPSSNSAFTTNYGLYLTGNGGANSVNYSLYNGSTAQSYFAGSIQTAASLTVGPLAINSSGVVTAGTWNGATLTPGYGGTGQSSYAVGDILYASGATTLSKLSDVATGSCLISKGIGIAPAWGSCGSGSSTLQADYTNGNTIAETAGNGVNITAAAVPTTDMLSISNAGQPVTTAGVNGVSVNYVGGNAAVESAGMRIDFAPGGTSGGTWSGLRVVANANGAVAGVTEYGIKIEGPTAAGSGTEEGAYIGSGWDVGLDIASGGIQMASQSDPATPAAGELRIYAKTIAGRVLPKWVGPSGVDTPFQASFGFNRIAMANPSGVTTSPTALNAFNAWGYTAAGSATTTSPALASTNLATSVRRERFSSGATAGTVAYSTSNATLAWRGNTSGIGGFYFTTRFMLSTLQTGNRGFVGLSDTITAPANVDPTTNTTPGKLGVAFNSSTGNLYWVNNITGTAPTATDLGATNFSVNTTSLYELIIFSPPNGGSITYRVKNLSNGNATADTTIATNIPSSTTFLAPMMWITNNTTAAAATLDSGGWYLESDN